MGKREAALTLYFLNPFPASALPTCQALRRGSVAGRSSTSKPFRKWAFCAGKEMASHSLSPFPHPYIALFPSPCRSLHRRPGNIHPSHHPRQAGLPACRPRCAKRGRGKERKAATASEGERWGFGRKGGLPSPLSLLRWAGSEKASSLTDCGRYPLFTGTGALAVLWTFYLFRSGQPQTTALSVSSEKDCKKGKAKQIKPDGSIRAKTIHTNSRHNCCSYIPSRLPCSLPPLCFLP